VTPRDAATVVVLRQAAQGIEVFSVRRHQKSGFLGGAVVFPGGKVDAADADGAWDALAGAPHPRVASMAGEASPRALAIAACREALEEAAILPTDPPIAADRAEALRKDAAGASLASLLARDGLRLAIDRLVPWARWVTPEAEARRFDARFFLLELPPGQLGRHDDHETTMSFWARPADVLARFERGEIFLAPPTTRTLELLAGEATIAGATELAARQSLEPVCPIFVPDATGGFLALPGDPSHTVRERRVDGPTRFVLRDGRFVGADPPVERPSL
jgi:8-oxo-dGTP pyrophosphatase MutT (NUDIX family)